MDHRLHSYLEAVEADLQQDRLSELTASAEPIIQRTVHSRLAGRWDDMADVCSEARLELLLHLRRIKADPAARVIEDFSAYVSGLAKNTCNQYFRRRRPGRSRLVKQLRFLLLEPEFRMWQRHGTTLCGLADWLDDRKPVATGCLPQQVEGERDLATLLRKIFETADGPIDFRALVEMVAGIWHIPSDPEDAAANIDIQSIPAAERDAELSIDRRRYAERLWQEIGQLPRAQRVALLLNLRDGRGNSVLSLFPLSGVASFTETAAALEVGEPELSGIWNELPWDDNAIARFLFRTRQQVINLRMSARKRLSNRLGEQPF